MTQAETPVMPLHMRRDRFAPVDELRELREGEGVRRFETPFGANVWIITRYADVREVLGDATRFSNRMAFRPPADPRSDEEREKARAGQLLAFDPPDFPGLAAWPALRRAVVGLWVLAQDWHNARLEAGLEAGLHHDARTGQVVAELERELGRKARPFSLDLVLLPVCDEQIRAAGADRYLVPERIYDGPQWPGLLRALLIPRA